jgi:hypothetical protein
MSRSLNVSKGLLAKVDFKPEGFILTKYTTAHSRGLPEGEERKRKT